MGAGDGGLPVMATGGPTTPPSIFNDVIGPVMRGPSSSHCAAAVRIGRLARDLMGGELEKVLVEFHPTGSLATTHESQGSDMGLFGGLMGWEATDDRLVESWKAIRGAGIEVEIRIVDFSSPHPNTYRLTLSNAHSRHQMTAISTGGGMVQVLEIDGAGLPLGGDYHETLVFLEVGVEGDAVALIREDLLGRLGPVGAEILIHPFSGHREDGAPPESAPLGSPTGASPTGASPTGASPTHLLQVKGRRFPSAEILTELRRHPDVLEVRTLEPALPIQSRMGMTVPFLCAEDLEAYNKTRGLSLWELAVLYESERGGIPGEEVMARMDSIVRILEGAVEEGLAGTHFEDRILGPQARAFQEKMEDKDLLDAGSLNRMILYVTAIMEVKSSMGVIVAAPTAGACGALPGACLGAAHAMGATRETVTRAMLAGGLVGVFIASGSTFAAEVCGCQAETGAGAGMAAAALVTLAGGTVDEALSAASMALQNTLGMICDPVANRVEVPCLGRNVLAAGNALASANMALAGFDSVIPLDEVIETMDEVGKSLPHQLRCTALGGLSITETSKRIQQDLEGDGTGR